MDTSFRSFINQWHPQSKHNKMCFSNRMKGCTDLVEYLQQSYLLWAEYKGWLSRLLCCKLRNRPMTNIRPNMQPTKHHFTSVNGSTRAQGPTGSPVPPSFSASLKGERERGAKKKVWSQSWHSKCTLHSRTVRYTKLIRKSKKERWVFLFGFWFFFLVTSFWPPCDRLTDYFSFSGFWQCFPALARPLPSLLRIY